MVRMEIEEKIETIVCKESVINLTLNRDLNHQEMIEVMEVVIEVEEVVVIEVNKMEATEVGVTSEEEETTEVVEDLEVEEDLEAGVEAEVEAGEEEEDKIDPLIASMSQCHLLEQSQLLQMVRMEVEEKIETIVCKEKENRTTTIHKALKDPIHQNMIMVMAITEDVVVEEEDLEEEDSEVVVGDGVVSEVEVEVDSEVEVEAEVAEVEVEAEKKTLT